MKTIYTNPAEACARQEEFDGTPMVTVLEVELRKSGITVIPGDDYATIEIPGRELPDVLHRNGILPRLLEAGVSEFAAQAAIQAFNDALRRATALEALYDATR